MMKPSPAGWPRISASLYYEDAGAAIDWLCRVFGFEVRIKVEGDNGRIVHSELSFGEDGLVMVATAGSGEEGQPPTASPKALGGRSTQGLAVYLDDVDAHFTRVKAAGAEIFRALATTDHGEDYWADRAYGVIDLEGHHWWFMQRMRTGKAV